MPCQERLLAPLWRLKPSPPYEPSVVKIGKMNDRSLLTVHS